MPSKKKSSRRLPSTPRKLAKALVLDDIPRRAGQAFLAACIDHKTGQDQTGRFQEVTGKKRIGETEYVLQFRGTRKRSGHMYPAKRIVLIPPQRGRPAKPDERVFLRSV